MMSSLREINWIEIDFVGRRIGRGELRSAGEGEGRVLLEPMYGLRFRLLVYLCNLGLCRCRTTKHQYKHKKTQQRIEE